MTYFNIFGRLIPTYGTMITLGLLLANVCAIFLIKKFKLSVDNFILLECFGLLFAAIGAKILYLIISFNQIDWSMMTNLNYLNDIMRGGFVFYGGLIGGFFGILLAGKIFKCNPIEYIEVVAPMVPLAHGFGRIGCFLVGCCFGMPYDGLGHIQYHESMFAPNGVNLLPVQLIEAICMFILFFILLALTLKNKYKNNIYIYFYTYGVIRFILEFFRYDAERGHIGMFSTSQWISIAIIVITFITQRVIRHREKKID